MCKKHPKYKAIIKPKVNCDKCLDMYYKKNKQQTDKQSDLRKINAAMHHLLYFH